MDSQAKRGKVYLQSHKAGKEWKPVWLSLFPHSCNGVGRLEIQDIGGDSAGGDHGAGIRRYHQLHVDRKLKVIRLSELISVLRLPPNAEACPMENMSAFCVETHDKTIVFAALKDDCVEWVENLCHSTFQRVDGSGYNLLHMEENQIYASADEEFWVVVQKTDAATRCGLQGSYWLQVGREALLLRDTQRRNILREWPYELLRRYGKDKLALTIEAGRRCDSGPGTFNFETQQAEKIFSLIQRIIKQKTSTDTLGNQNQKGENVMVQNIQGHSPLPKIPGMTSLSAILESKLRTQDRKSTGLKDSAHAQEDLFGSSKCVSSQPAPITLTPLPLIPIHDSHSGHLGDQSEAAYADPIDCIQSVPKLHPTMALYVDPASVLPIKPPSSRESATPPPDSYATYPCFNSDHPDMVYSEVYDKISLFKNKQTIQNKAKAMCLADDEPIYTYPMSKIEEVSHKNENKSDQFVDLYAQVCKTKQSPSPFSFSKTISSSSSSVTATMSTTKGTDDEIYENLGTI